MARDAVALTIIRLVAGKEAIIFDAVMREGNESIATPTKRPVEQGADITDHIRLGEDTFSIDAYVSNTPIEVPQTQMGGVTGRVSGVALDVPASPFNSPIGIPLLGTAARALGVHGVKPQVKANVLNFSGPVRRIQNVYDALYEIQSTSELVTVVGFLRTYEDMNIDRLSAPRVSGESGLMLFTVDFSRIRRATTKTVAAPKDRNAQKPTNRGQQTPKETTNPADRNSVTFNLFN